MIQKRIDVLLTEKGFADSRERAKKIIKEGSVYVGTKKIDKPGEKIDEDSVIEVKKDPLVYVGRGGFKLEKAINEFNITLKGKSALDIGASTGGFTDCMLQKGAGIVVAIDVGYGQLDLKIRNNPKVIVKERTNIRYLKKEDLDVEGDFASVDVSFISLRLVLSVVKELLKGEGEMVALIKPQFEAGKNNVGKKGIVRDYKIHENVIIGLRDYCDSIGMGMCGLTYSPIKGKEGNTEYLSFIKKEWKTEEVVDNSRIKEVIKSAHKLL